MPKQFLENKFGNKIQYDPNGKKYRYYVDGEPKASVTTTINKRTRPDLQNWYKRNRDDSMREVMLEDNQPIDKINFFINRVKEKAEKKESFGRDIGSQLHDWIDIYLKSKKKPTLPESEPLRTMATKWLRFWKGQKFKVVASELPLYSSRFDRCGTNDVIVTKDSWKGQNAVLDWKTSKDYSFDQAIQVEIYRRFIEETTNFKIQKLAIVNIPKEPQKEVSMYILKVDDSYYKGFKAMTYLDQLESNFNKDLKKWKKENNKNATNK
jgi:hypothetical protein